MIDLLDPRLVPQLRDALAARLRRPVEPLPSGVTVALVGHRAAGKTTLLPEVARRLGRPAVDLDAELERRHERKLREWVLANEPEFRAAEKACFLSLPKGSVVACGGGFLSHHPDALVGTLPVLVPVTWETFVERLKADTTRPRLFPTLTVEQELQRLWLEREQKHRLVRTLDVVEFAARLDAGLRARRVVTLPPGESPREFAYRALRHGAELLEVRTDLIPLEVDLTAAARVLPLLVSERVTPIPKAWRALAQWVDYDVSSQNVESGGPVVLSHHASRPLRPEEADALWAEKPAGSWIKHVEPLGAPSDAARLFETQRRLVHRFGQGRVTVLTMGREALPFRALLSRHNGLEYLALDADFAAAPGQRLLADATREHRAGNPPGARLAILGSKIGRSRSPAIHPQPFDRLDLDPTTEMAPLLAALLPHYKGFAVTSPFKKPVARALDTELEAVNTLWRSPDGWKSANTDVAGARAVLQKLGASSVTVLGAGGAAVAIEAAAAELGVTLLSLPRASVTAKALSGAVVWTWPPTVEAPEHLRFENATVAVIAYGAAGRSVASVVRARGGTPLRLGAKWFVAQAREQRKLWDIASP